MREEVSIIIDTLKDKEKIAWIYELCDYLKKSDNKTMLIIMTLILVSIILHILKWCGFKPVVAYYDKKYDFIKAIPDGFKSLFDGTILFISNMLFTTMIVLGIYFVCTDQPFDLIKECAICAIGAFLVRFI